MTRLSHPTQNFPIIDGYHTRQGYIVKNSLAGENGILVSGRGFGKSIAGRGSVYLNAVNYNGFMPPLSKTKMFNVIAMPFLNQAKRVHWLPLEYLFTETPLASLVKNINRAEGMIELKGDRPGILLTGVNDDLGDRIRGLSIPRLFLDEFQDIKSGIWSAIKPAVDRCLGSVLVAGTPKGKGTYFHKFTLQMVKEFGWHYYHYYTEHNPKLPNLEQMLLEAQRGLTEREYRAEFKASWEDFPGQIFDMLDSVNILSRDRFPDSFDSAIMGVDWGDINPAIVVIGLKNFPYDYYLVDFWQGNLDGGTRSIPFDDVLKKAVELSTKWNVHSTYPDVFQPGNINYIYEFRQSESRGVSNIVDPASSDYQRMRSLKVMPSCALLNRLLKQQRFFIWDHKEILNRFNGYIRKQDREGNFLEEPDPNCKHMEHILDCCRYAIANVETTLALTYGYGSIAYSPFSSDE